MAFAGLHVAIYQVRQSGGGAPLPGQMILSKTLTASGQIGQVPATQEGGLALMRAEGSVDFFIGTSETDAATALAKSADPSLNRRLNKSGSGPYDYWVKAGDFIAVTVV